MAQPAGYSKNLLNTNPFWERASAEPPLEWTKVGSYIGDDCIRKGWDRNTAFIEIQTNTRRTR